MYPFGSLPDNLIAFCRFLRGRYDFAIGPGETHDAVRALAVVDLADEQAVRHVLRPVLSARREDAAVFDTAFKEFFFPGPAGVRQTGLPPRRRAFDRAADDESRDAPARSARASDAAPDDRAGDADAMLEPVAATDADAEGSVSLARASYSPLDADDAARAPEIRPADAAWHDAARSLVRRVHLGLSRRWRPARQGRRFDLRRTLRGSLQTGGEPLMIRWLKRPRRTPRFVLLVDGSRSMSGAASAALDIAVALAGVTMRVETFTFSTELRRVTEAVRRAAAGETVRIARLRHAWGGGTAIGACFRDFLRRFGDRLLGPQTLVVIASDGLDVGQPDLLRDTMREIHRRSAGVVWLNPLLETAGYEPTASGMLAARPFITTFAAAGDAPALERLSRLVRVRA